MNIKEIDLSFVSDDNVRAVLENYYFQARRAFEAKAYLGTIVTCGSVAEGILTWMLLSKEREALSSKKAPKDQKSSEPKPIKLWYLPQLIAVSVELGLLGKTAERGSWALKDFRNFIHVYNLLEQSARPDEALALNGLTAIEEITRSVRGRLAK
jgi:hypothetical protein